MLDSFENLKTDYKDDGYQAFKAVDENLRKHLIAREHKLYKIVIIEQNMPIMNGLALVERIKFLYREANKTPPKFLMLTSMDDIRFKQLALR